MGDITVKGDYSKTKNFLTSLENKEHFSQVEQFGAMGVEALAAVTPIRTGKTANSWGYEIEEDDQNYIITWTNSNVHKGKNIAVLLDSGHGTRNGFYITGRNYIEPALDPIVDQIINNIKGEVSRL